MNPAKVSSICEYLLPRLQSDLRTFIGICSYYSKFVLVFSNIAASLHGITSEKVLFGWDGEKRSCFERLRTIVSTTPVLAQPDMEGARRTDQNP